MSTPLSSLDTTATDTDSTPQTIDSTTPTTLISWSQEQTITSNGSPTSDILDSKSTSTLTTHALPSLPSSGVVAPSDVLTHDHLALHSVSLETAGSLITGATAPSPPVTTEWSSSYVIFQTTRIFTNGAYLDESIPVATVFNFPQVANAIGALQHELSLVPPDQAAVTSEDSAQPSQLDQPVAPAPSPAQSRTVDPGPHLATGQGQNHPSNQAASLPGLDNHGSAAPAYILLGSSTYFLPRITTQPAPVVAAKPIVDLGGGTFRVNSLTISRGGAAANIEGVSVHVNPQGAPVVGTQTYTPLPTAATSTIGTHTVVVNTAGVIFDDQQIVTNATPLNAKETQMPFQTASVTPGSAANGPMANEPAGADIPPSDSILKRPSEPAVSSMLIGGVPVIYDKDGLKVQGTPLAAGANIALSGTTWALSPSSAGDSIHLNVGTQIYHLPQMTPPPLANIAGHEVQALGPSVIAVDGQTLTQGAPSLTISPSIPVIFGPSNLVIGTNTIPIRPQDEAPPPSILNLAGGQSLTQVLNNPNAYLISSTTLLPGSPPAIISGTSYSLAQSGALIVGSSTIPLATAGSNAANGVLTAGSKAFMPLGSTAVAVNGATLSLNGPEIKDHGTVLSLGSGGLVVGASTYAFATPAPSAAATAQQFPITTILSAGGQTFTANPSGFSIADTTLSPGSPALTISGTLISLGTSGILTIDSSTINLSPTALTIASQTFTPNPTAFPIDGTTLTAGGPGVTLSATPVLLQQDGVLVIGNTTIALPLSNIASATSTPNPSTSSINTTDSITTIASGSGTANGILIDVGGGGSMTATAAPTKTTDKAIKGGAVGMRTSYKKSWWEVGGLVGGWSMMMVMMMLV